MHNLTLDSIVKQTTTPKGKAQINVGQGPIALIFDSIRHNLYVSNRWSTTVSVINGSTNTKIEDIPVGQSPFALALDPNRDKLYVANIVSNTVSVIERSTNTNLKNITVGVNPVALAFDTFGDTLYVANQGSGTVSVINGSTNTNLKNITVGVGAGHLAFYPNGNKLYVGNVLNDTLSVIDASTNTNIKNLTVGQSPTALALYIDPLANTLYVANRGSNTVSVIDTTDDINIRNITVGQSPNALAFDPNGEKLYVANTDNDTVSVIDTSTNTNIKNIAVGEGPFALAFDEVRFGVYVSNQDSNGISLIDPVTNNVLARVAFDITPIDSGHVTCNDINFPPTQYLYVSSGTICIAKPNKGFEFSNWLETLSLNSTRTIVTSNVSNSPLNSFLDFFNIKLNDPAAALNVTAFGSYTANFKALPSPIPPEYLLTLFGIMLGVIIPSLLHWDKGRRQRRNLREYIEELPSKYKLGRIKLDDEITDLYTKGKINESQHAMLRNKIAEYYDQEGKSRSPIKT